MISGSQSCEPYQSYQWDGSIDPWQETLVAPTQPCSLHPQPWQPWYMWLTLLGSASKATIQVLTLQQPLGCRLTWMKQTPQYYTKLGTALQHHSRRFLRGLGVSIELPEQIVDRTSLQSFQLKNKWAKVSSRFSSFSAFASPSCASSLRAHRAAKVNRQSPLPGAGHLEGLKQTNQQEILPLLLQAVSSFSVASCQTYVIQVQK